MRYRWLPPLPPVPDPPEPPATDVTADGEEVLPRWQPWMAPAALVSAFALAVFGGLIVGGIASAFGSSVDNPPPSVNVISTAVQDAAFILCAVMYARMTEVLRPGFFGLRRVSLWLAVRWVVGAGVVFYVFTSIWAAAVNITETDQLPNDLGTRDSVAALICVCVLVCVVAPIAEEFLFRGFIFTSLRTWRGPWVAAVTTGVVFGAIHAGSAPAAFLVPLGVFGFLLCLVRWRTQSLLPCISLHALNNAIAFGANEAGWNVWQTILLICGAVAAVLLVTRPFLERSVRQR